MKYLIVSDIHTHIDTADRIINGVPHDVVVCLGDFFHDFNDTPESNGRTAEWLKAKLSDPTFIACWGNHDIASRWQNYATSCSGWGPEKQRAISAVMDEYDWNKFVPFYHIGEGNWLLSHGGVCPHIFKDPERGLTLSVIRELCDAGLHTICRGEDHPAFCVGYERGGINQHGGITWQSFGRLIPIPEFRQVVGHTPSWPVPQVRFFGKGNNVRQQSVGNFNGWNTHPEAAVCLDTHNKHYAIIDNGSISFHETSGIVSPG